MPALINRPVNCFQAPTRQKSIDFSAEAILNNRPPLTYRQMEMPSSVYRRTGLSIIIFLR